MLRLSKGSRARGRIKSTADDFRVEEIARNGTILGIGNEIRAESLGMDENPEGKFALFVMQKRDWNTTQALKTLARRMRRGIKSTGFAGTKDRTSVSTQLCSMFGVRAHDLRHIHVKDIAINGAWQSSTGIRIGDLLGNRFSITVRELSGGGNVGGMIDQLGGVFPNYFGEQRFGNRNANVAIGLDILKGDFESAVMRFLTDSRNESNEDAVEARKRLESDMDFNAAMDYFPGYLKYERTMLEYLSRFPKNYANAIRKLPRSISLMFVHSVEAQMFNMELEGLVKEGKRSPGRDELSCAADANGFPDISTTGRHEENATNRFMVGRIIGYDSTDINDTERRLMDELGITEESFKVKGMAELNAKGTYRVLFAPFLDIRHEENDELETCTIGFSLPSGSYATVLIDELVETY